MNPKIPSTPSSSPPGQPRLSQPSSSPPTPPPPVAPPVSTKPVEGSTEGGSLAPSGLPPGMAPMTSPFRAGPGSMRQPAKPTMHPRRVVGGLRLTTRGAGTAGNLSINALAGLSPDALAGAETEEEAEQPPQISKAVLLGKTSAKVEASASASDSSSPSTAGDPASPAPSVHWTWASARWMRLAEDFAPGEQLAEGFEYARLGQTRQIDISSGHLVARVQGRMPQAYRVGIRLPTFSPEQWETVTTTMAAQAKYAAGLLASELPANIEDIFGPMGLRLFPVEPSDLSCQCECDVYRALTARAAREIALPGTSSSSSVAVGKSAPPPARLPWCKHICCVMYLLSERLAQHPLTIFALRGLPEVDLLERLRQQRTLAGLARTGTATTPVYTPHVPTGPAAISGELSAGPDFWTGLSPDALAELDTPIEPPAVSHPLLRRVGPSPFTGAKFPLVGLLATCYDVISEKTIQSTQSSPDEGSALDSSGPGPSAD